MRRIVLLAAVSLLAVACTSEYHPEYHPVTVSNFQQDLTYPVTVNNGVPSAPVYVVPGQATAPLPLVMAQPQGPPPGFFARQ